MIKFCKDCKHIKLPKVSGLDDYEYARCKRGEVAEVINLVTGDSIVTDMPYCGLERTSRGVGRCGVEGVHFEPAE